MTSQSMEAGSTQDHDCNLATPGNAPLMALQSGEGLLTHWNGQLQLLGAVALSSTLVHGIGVQIQKLRSQVSMFLSCVRARHRPHASVPDSLTFARR